MVSPDRFTMRQACIEASPALAGALGHALGLDTQLILNEHYFVVKVANRPGCFAGCGGWSDRKTLFGSDHAPHRPRELLDPQTDPAKIRAIFVHPEWARQGVGTMLLRHCKHAALSAGFHRLVWDSL